jgi:hypothetical protein
MADTAPRTAEAFFALPIVKNGGYTFGMSQRVIDGKAVTVPVLERQPVAFWVDDDTPNGWTDEDGNPWKLIRYDDGSWARTPIE